MEIKLWIRLWNVGVNQNRALMNGAQFISPLGKILTYFYTNMPNYIYCLVFSIFINLA